MSNVWAGDEGEKGCWPGTRGGGLSFELWFCHQSTSSTSPGTSHFPALIQFSHFSIVSTVPVGSHITASIVWIKWKLSLTCIRGSDCSSEQGRTTSSSHFYIFTYVIPLPRKATVLPFSIPVFCRIKQSHAFKIATVLCVWVVGLLRAFITPTGIFLTSTWRMHAMFTQYVLPLLSSSHEALKWTDAPWNTLENSW